jgi:hypothetical protein
MRTPTAAVEQARFHDRPAEFITAIEAEAFSTLSLKTLQRRQKEGCDTGLRKHGRRVLFHVDTLRKFLTAEMSKPSTK